MVDPNDEKMPVTEQFYRDDYTSGAWASQASVPISIGFNLLLLIYAKRGNCGLTVAGKGSRIRRHEETPRDAAMFAQVAVLKLIPDAE